MKTPLPLSAFIITRDEEERIGRAVSSLRGWVSETIVVDSGSADATREVAANLSARVVENEWRGFGQQKRFAESLCQERWLLNIDADEEVTPRLRDEIVALFANGLPPCDGYAVFAADVFPHEDKPAAWASGKWFVRLYDARKGRFAESSVHDNVVMDEGARIGRLRAPLHHRSTRSLDFTIKKANYYTSMQVDDLQRQRRRFSRWRLLFEFPVSFLKSYLLRRAFLYGFWGFVHAINYGFFRHLRVAKQYEAELMKRKRDKAT